MAKKSFFFFFFFSHSHNSLSSFARSMIVIKLELVDGRKMTFSSYSIREAYERVVSFMRREEEELFFISKKENSSRERVKDFEEFEIIVKSEGNLDMGEDSSYTLLVSKRLKPSTSFVLKRDEFTLKRLHSNERIVPMEMKERYVPLPP